MNLSERKIKRTHFCIGAGIVAAAAAFPFLPDKLELEEPIDEYEEEIGIDFKHYINIAAERNIMVLDSDRPGLSKRLISLMRVVMRRAGPVNPLERITDLFVPKSMVKQEKIFGVTMHELPHMCQKYYLDDLKGSLPTRKRSGAHRTQIVLGIDRKTWAVLLGCV